MHVTSVLQENGRKRARSLYYEPSESAGVQGKTGRVIIFPISKFQSGSSHRSIPGAARDARLLKNTLVALDYDERLIHIAPENETTATMILATLRRLSRVMDDHLAPTPFILVVVISCGDRDNFYRYGLLED